jgi:hypothetical protein
MVDTVAHSADLHPAQIRYDITSREVPGCLTFLMLAAWYAARSTVLLAALDSASIHRQWTG